MSQAKKQAIFQAKTYAKVFSIFRPLVSDGADLAVGARQELAVPHRLGEPHVVEVEHVVHPVELTYLFPVGNF